MAGHLSTEVFGAPSAKPFHFIPGGMMRAIDRVSSVVHGCLVTDLQIYGNSDKLESDSLNEIKSVVQTYINLCKRPLSI